MGALQQALSSYTPANPAPATAPAQPQPAASPANGAPRTAQQILMIAPSGEAAYVPQDQVASYQAKGAKVGIRMVAPDGKEKAIVPFDQQDDFQKKGARWDASPDNDAAKAFLTQQSAAKQLNDLGDQNRFMVSAMTGQGKDFSQDPTLSPGERKQAVAGREAGTIAGGIQVATAPLSALAAPGVITEEAATGLLDEFGEPITREIIEQGPSLLGKGFQAASEWAAEHPIVAKRLIQAVGIGFGLKAWNELSKIEKEFGGK